MSKKKAEFAMGLFFQALGDETRLRLLNLMGEQEICVCFLVEVLGQAQPKVSRHLAYLRRAGIVAARRDGKWVHYRMVMPDHAGAAGILRRTLKWMAEDEALLGDRKRLGKAVAKPHKFVSLVGAPLPGVVG